MSNNEDAQIKRMQKRFDKWLSTRNKEAVHTYLDSFPEESFEVNTPEMEKLLGSLSLMASYLCFLETIGQYEPLFWFCSAVAKYYNPLFISLLMEMLYELQCRQRDKVDNN